MPTAFAQLEKQAGVGSLAMKGVKGLFNNGVWKTLGTVADKGVKRTDILGSLARGAKPVANVMNGKVGKGLGLYGMAGLVSPMAGVDLPGSNAAFALGAPGFAALYNGAAAVRSGRMAGKDNQKALKADVEVGADRAMQDYLSGLQVMPSVGNDVDAYRSFSQQIGRDMKGADTYTAGGYKDMGTWGKLKSMFEDPQEMITNRTRMEVQGQMPGLFAKKAAMPKILGKLGGGFGKVMTGLGLLGGGIGLGNAVFGDKPYDAEAAQSEGYAAAQAAIQHKLKNMSGMERMMAKWDPSAVAMAVGRNRPGALKSWEAQHGAVQPGMIASTVEAFRSGGTPKYFSTDAGGNKNYV